MYELSQPALNEDFIIKGFNIKIGIEDILSLHFNILTDKYNLVNDAIVDFYINMPCYFQKYKKILAISSYYFTRYFTNLKISNPCYEEENRCYNSNIFKFNHTLIPIRNNNHWSLIWIDYDNKNVIYLDSNLTETKKLFISQCFEGAKNFMVNISKRFSTNEKPINLNVNE